MLSAQDAFLLEDIDGTVSELLGARVARSASSLSVCASDAQGFDMAFVVEAGRVTLAFDEWVEEFDDSNQAHAIFKAALGGTARLKVDLLSGRKWRWTLELEDASGSWRPESTIGHITWRFWGRSSVVYLRNDFGLF